MVPTALTQSSGSGFETSAQQRWFSSWLLFIYWKLLLVTQKEKQLEKAYITQFYIRQDHYGQSQVYKKTVYWKAPKSKHFFFQEPFNFHVNIMFLLFAFCFTGLLGVHFPFFSDLMKTRNFTVYITYPQPPQTHTPMKFLPITGSWALRGGQEGKKKKYTFARSKRSRKSFCCTWHASQHAKG